MIEDAYGFDMGGGGFCDKKNHSEVDKIVIRFHFFRTNYDV